MRRESHYKSKDRDDDVSIKRRQTSQKAFIFLLKMVMQRYTISLLTDIGKLVV